MFTAVSGSWGFGPWDDDAPPRLPASSPLSSPLVHGLGSDGTEDAEELWCRKLVSSLEGGHVAAVGGPSSSPASAPPSPTFRTISLSGAAFAFGHATRFARAGGVACAFVGTPVANAAEVRSLYGLGHPKGAPDCGASLLLDLYLRGFEDADGDASDQPATVLSLLSSSFAFVLADSTRHAVLAARSPPAAAAAASPVAPPHHVGATPTAPLPEPPALWWATARDGTLLFGTAEPPLARACARPETGPAPFPGGCTFFEAQAWAGGRLAAFGRAPGRRDVTPVRRVNSKGVLCALGWHSASGAELAAIPAAVRV